MADHTSPTAPPAPPTPIQRICVEPSVHGWTETRIDTFGTDNKVASETLIRWRAGWRFVDVSITEYAFMSRRAKITEVRLGEEAAQNLYETLGAILGAGVRS